MCLHVYFNHTCVDHTILWWMEWRSPPPCKSRFSPMFRSSSQHSAQKNMFWLDHWNSSMNMNSFIYNLRYTRRLLSSKCPFCTLTINVRGPSYLGLTRSITWLLRPWPLTSPEHQQPCYWLCRICRSWSYLRKEFKYLWVMRWNISICLCSFCKI